MTRSASYIPDGYHNVTPILAVRGAAQLIDFLRRVFDGQESERVVRPDGAIIHAEVTIGDSKVMLSEATGDMAPTPAAIYVYVTDADATYQRALDAGATSLMAPADMFYGDRSGAVKDPFGNSWWIATHVEDVPAEELRRRLSAM